MRRKMRLIHRLLEYVEMSETENLLPVPEIDDYTEAQVHYHIRLCEAAGYLIAAQPHYATERPKRFGGIAELTWEGHETLERMRKGQ